MSEQYGGCQCHCGKPWTDHDVHYPVHASPATGEGLWWMVEDERGRYWTGEGWTAAWQEGARFASERSAAKAAGAVGSFIDGAPWRVHEHAYFSAPATGEGLEELRFAKALTEYGCHHGNCPFDSWNKGLTRCKCGLFQLIKAANKALAATTLDTEDR